VPRKRTPLEYLEVNLEMCNHEVQRLRAELVANKAERERLEARVAELLAMVNVMEAQMPNGDD
jgi:hypothetical protein